jgi:glycerate 2-kinase
MSHASEALEIARAGIRAVDPALAVRSGFLSGAVDRWLGRRKGAVHLVAIGKAAAPMATAAAAELGARLAGGVAVVREAGALLPPSVERLVGSHPLPTGASFRAGAAVLSYVGRLTPLDRVLFLISGGGSSLAESPADGVGLSAVRRTTEALLASGAPIQSMNSIRRHLSALKGGRLAAATGAARWTTFAISDVVGDAPEEVSSGPTVEDPTTFADAQTAVERYGLTDRLPPAVLRHLEEGAAGRHAETIKPGDPRLAGGRFQFVATNRLALRGAATEAARRGFRVVVTSGHLTGETLPVGTAFARNVSRIRSRRPVALLAGGETTVTLAEHSGTGGRNQEFALAAAPVLDGQEGRLVLSIGTDGVDGPTDAAGGWADGETMAKARALGIDVIARLARHDAYPTLEALGRLVRTGPTGTNVMDLHVGLAVPAAAKRSAPRRAPRRAGRGKKSR